MRSCTWKHLEPRLSVNANLKLNHSMLQCNTYHNSKSEWSKMSNIYTLKNDYQMNKYNKHKSNCGNQKFFGYNNFENMKTMVLLPTGTNTQFCMKFEGLPKLLEIHSWPLESTGHWLWISTVQSLEKRASYPDELGFLLWQQQCQFTLNCKDPCQPFRPGRIPMAFYSSSQPQSVFNQECEWRSTKLDCFLDFNSISEKELYWTSQSIRFFFHHKCK